MKLWHIAARLLPAAAPVVRSLADGRLTREERAALLRLVGPLVVALLVEVAGVKPSASSSSSPPLPGILPD